MVVQMDVCDPILVLNSIYMKKILFTLFLACLVQLLMAGPIDENAAKNKAMQFLSQCGLRSNVSLVNVTPEQYDGLYILNFSDGKGFVIVSGDDNAVSVLAYSLDKSFKVSNIPTTVSQWLNGYEKELEALASGEVQSDPTMPEYVVDHSRSVAEVAPLIQSRWDQGQYYNNLCPADAAFNSDTYLAGHVCTGCTNTAMAQVMRYWRWPEHGTGSHSYSWANDHWVNWNYGTLSANFEDTYYDWDNMPDELTASSTPQEVEAVATLMYHCGVANESFYNDYEDGSTGAYITAYELYPEYGYDHCAEYSFPQYFGYKDTIQGFQKNDFNNTTWISMLKDEFDAGRPVVYGGYTGGGYYAEGHCFILDGYDNQSRFHVNWGWSGEYDGYFTLSALRPYDNYNFSSDQCGLFYVMPDRSQTSVEERTSNADFHIYGSKKNIHILNANGQQVAVYDLLGRNLMESQCSSDNFTMPVQTSGVYIVRVGSTLKKVMVCGE